MFSFLSTLNLPPQRGGELAAPPGPPGGTSQGRAGPGPVGRVWKPPFPAVLSTGLSSSQCVWFARRWPSHEVSRPGGRRAQVCEGEGASPLKAATGSTLSTVLTDTGLRPPTRP